MQFLPGAQSGFSALSRGSCRIRNEKFRQPLSPWWCWIIAIPESRPIQKSNHTKGNAGQNSASRKSRLISPSPFIANFRIADRPDNFSLRMERHLAEKVCEQETCTPIRISFQSAPAYAPDDSVQYLLEENQALRFACQFAAQNFICITINESAISVQPTKGSQGWQPFAVAIAHY